MNVNIQTVHFDADVKLKSHIEKKIEKLLALQEGIEKNGKYMDTLRQKLFFLVFEISVIILILIIYSWFFFFP